jgi:group I intron endonuclease
MAHIYKITNKLNNKIYIGRTDQEPETRWKQHKRYSKYVDTPLYFAMRKYGTDNFKFEVIETCENAGEREMFWIDETSALKDGYNATIGGDGGIAKYTADDLLKLKELYENEPDTKKLEKITGVQRATVYSILKYHGIYAVRSKGWYQTRKANHKKTYCPELNLTTKSRVEMAEKLVELGYFKSLYGAKKSVVQGLRLNTKVGRHKLTFRDID